MNLHEYQAKILLKNNDVRVLNGYPVLDDNIKVEILEKELLHIKKSIQYQLKKKKIEEI